MVDHKCVDGNFIKRLPAIVYIGRRKLLSRRERVYTLYDRSGKRLLLIKTAVCSKQKCVCLEQCIV